MGKKAFFRLIFLLSFSSCSLSSLKDPYTLAPTNPYSTWTPLEGNQLVSTKYCQTLLPPSFHTEKLALAQLLDIALQNNPSTKQSWAAARAAAAEYGVSLSAFYPNAVVSGFFYRQRAGFPETGIPTATPGQPTTISAGSSSGSTIQENYFSETGPDITLSYTLFDFGQRTAAATAARESLYYADLSHNQQIQSVLQIVMEDYYEYLYQKSVETAYRDNLTNAETSLDAANEKFSLGLASLSDVAQARTQFLQSKIDLNTQKQQLEISFAQLAVDLGLPANIPFQVEELPEKIDPSPIMENLDSLIGLAQEKRQDFLAAEANYRSKKASWIQAKRARYPTINSQLSTGRYWFNKGLVEPKGHWSAVISLTLPLFDGFSLRNQMKSAEANMEMAKAQVLSTELSLIQNVTTAHSGVKAAALNLKDSEEYLKAAELEFKIALENYKAGTNTILDLLKAQNFLADSRSKKALAQKDWFSSLAKIAFATGTLCTPPCKEVL